MRGLDLQCLATTTNAHHRLSRGLLSPLLFLSFLMGGLATLVVVLAPQARAEDSSRHYEKVSPAEKGHGDIVGDGGTNIASEAGDAVTLSTRTPFGDTVSSGVSGHTQYVARRGAGGWVAHAITPQHHPSLFQVFDGPTRFNAFSHDLRAAVVWAYDLPAASGDVPSRNNIYVEDTATRALEPVTMFQNGLPNPLPNAGGLASDANWGVSADARHVAFVSRVPYLPSAPTNGSFFGLPNIYQWDDGVLSLAGILPDGSIPSTGSDAAHPLYRSSMSADGTRLLFTAAPVGNPGGNRQLYQRIDGTRTIWISQSEIDPSTDPSGVSLRAATPDGRTVIFSTESPLVAEDDNGGPDIYRYTDSANPSSDANLTLIKQNGEGGDTTKVVGVSDDGRRVYYHTLADEVFVWDDGTTDLVAANVFSRPQEFEGLGVDASAPGLGRITPDGSVLAFATRSGEANGHRAMFVYNRGDDTLRCVSCPSTPATSDVTVSPEATAGVVRYNIPGIRPRFLSDDGQVFFSTADALVSHDVNGVADTYEYDVVSETLRLVSSGKGGDPATFTDASASGDDVFFVTRQRLVSSDEDDLVDLYDARIGDALPDVPRAAPPSSCEGEACQPPAAREPADDVVGSLTFDDGGGGGSAVGLRVHGRFVVRGATGALRVGLSAPGRVSWRGRGLRSGSVRRGRSGALVLRVRLARSARAKLRDVGRYATSVRLTLASADGDVRRTTRVTFIAAAKRGR